MRREGGGEGRVGGESGRGEWEGRVGGGVGGGGERYTHTHAHKTYTLHMSR